MTDDLGLARRAVACPGWRWLPGMMRMNGERLIWCNETEREWATTTFSKAGIERALARWHLPRDLPDLTDPATLGCMLAMVREVHGPSTVVRHIGYDGKGGKEWAVCDRSPLVNGWHLAAPDLGYWTSEAEALVAAMENAP